MGLPTGSSASDAVPSNGIIEYHYRVCGKGSTNHRPGLNLISSFVRKARPMAEMAGAAVTVRMTCRRSAPGSGPDGARGR